MRSITAILLFAVLATHAGAQAFFKDGCPEDTTGLVAWYSTDKATVSSGLYQSFQNRMGTASFGNLAPWDSNPATNIVASLNGYPAARFDGVNDRYEAAITGTLNGAVHVFFVAKARTWTGGYNQFFNLNEDDMRVQEDGATSGKINLIRKSGGSDVGFDHTANIPTNTVFIASWKFNGASSRSYVRYNGTESVQTGTCGTNSISSTFRLPWFTGLDLDLYEIRVYNRAMTAADETNNIVRFRRKYNL